MPMEASPSCIGSIWISDLRHSETAKYIGQNLVCSSASLKPSCFSRIHF
jgi:hypothetical protein